MLITEIKNVTNQWQPFFQTESKQDYFLFLNQRLTQEYQQSQCFPAPENIFRAFKLCNLSEIKVLILGQDPYYNGCADGLCFSSKNAKLPASLNNIFNEIERSFQSRPINGDLSMWAKQGVLLLNTILSVRSQQANSHTQLGWETFTRHVLDYIYQTISHPIVCLIWGSSARALINEVISCGVKENNKFIILTSTHPSPYSYDMKLKTVLAFKGNDHFKKANQELILNNLAPIQWLN